ncbi:membrane protein insertion efficiency factor YidD [Isobaculum melis]|uniref:Putative membrane protein insertion efficiency factor n=1 Tax=Isobaculum melis TaxID=142588 RepID=A0A1H9QHT5_9LACT|nr:membrane protein insertion efficiency factor YidD [Isobaculum melis]SER59998.1 hypothetical protein SAMN04488559_10286 [Isobaculum melis]
MKRLFILPIRGYQKFISPLFPPSCRYAPSCSHYAVKAIEKHGVVKGSIMGISRIIRCNPFVKGGNDAVPDYFTLKKAKEGDLDDKSNRSKF